MSRAAAPWRAGRGPGTRPSASTPLPGGPQAHAQALFWAWALHAGLALFAAWWMWQRGVWNALVVGDPTGISVGITVMAVVVSGWAGRRAWHLASEAMPGSAWRRQWEADARERPDQAAALLSERTHGPHETAWWFAAAAIKLGLLGTVIGFIVMSMQIGRMTSFEFSEVQVLLQQMTGGMAIALYTTLAGVVANLWMGLQLLLLDRLADRLAADVLSTPPPATPRTDTEGAA
jgi:hypothetical protein